jgi:hypothetical protein
MARRVFFSFHHQRDIFRVSQIRNCGVFNSGDTQPFLDAAEWEKVRREGESAVKNWIDRQMDGTSVIIICIGNETYKRKWVRYEIMKAYQAGKGILGIHIHNMKSINSQTDDKGINPLDQTHITQNGREIPLSLIFPTYDWILNDGRKNISNWIDEAAIKIGR